MQLHDFAHELRDHLGEIPIQVTTRAARLLKNERIVFASTTVPVKERGSGDPHAPMQTDNTISVTLLPRGALTSITMGGESGGRDSMWHGTCEEDWPFDASVTLHYGTALQVQLPHPDFTHAARGRIEDFFPRLLADLAPA